jgi:hypothetical protein
MTSGPIRDRAQAATLQGRLQRVLDGVVDPAASGKTLAGTPDRRDNPPQFSLDASVAFARLRNFVLVTILWNGSDPGGSPRGCPHAPRTLSRLPMRGVG